MDNVVGSPISQVKHHSARLVLGWVTACASNLSEKIKKKNSKYHIEFKGMYIITTYYTD